MKKEVDSVRVNVETLLSDLVPVARAYAAAFACGVQVLLVVIAKVFFSTDWTNIVDLIRIYTFH